MGTVELESGSQKSTHFKDEKGTPLAAGPIVSVRLHPSDITVACRVASQFAGGGEGSWFPVSPGDEVIVGVPEGTERAGCVIIGRLGNAIDGFPTNVAGADPTENNFAFQKMRSPFLLETSGSYMVRSDTTLAQFAMDGEGNITLAAGSGQQLVLRSDFASFSLGDNTAKVQLDPEDSSVLLLAGDQATTLHLEATSSAFLTTGSLNIGTGGGPGNGHAVTLEQVISLLANFVIAGQLNPIKLFNPLLPAPLAITALNTILAAAIAGTALPSPLSTVPGGIMIPALPLVFGPTGAIGVALQNPAPQLDITGFYPGTGRATFLL